MVDEHRGLPAQITVIMQSHVNHQTHNSHRRETSRSPLLDHYAYGLRGSAKIPAVLTNTGFVNEKWQNSTPHTESTPLNLSLKYATDDYVGDPYGYAKLGANPSTGSSSSQQNYIGLCPFSVTRSPRLTGQTDDGLSHLMARFKR